MEMIRAAIAEIITKYIPKQKLNGKYFVITSGTLVPIDKVKGETLGSMGRPTSSNIFKILENQMGF